MSRGKKRPKKKRASPPPPPKARRSWTTPAICFGLVAITCLIFGRSIGYDFFNYDDSFYVYQNHWISDGLTRAGMERAFTHALVGNWHPLTSLSLMLDAQIFGLNPGGYHGVNVALHTVAVLLLFFALRSMTGAVWRSALVAALFAIHPLRAESVVWISERKDVLSGVFFMLGLWAYSRYAQKPPRLRLYLLVAAALILGLLSKSMLVTFPCLLLVLDYWPLRRFSFSPIWTGSETEERPAARTIPWLLLEKAPLLLLAIAISVATIFSQEQALNAAQGWPLRWRVENALVTVWVYLRQMFWPAHLAPFYPHPKDSLPLWVVSLCLVALLAVLLAVFSARRRHPYLITGWLWYLGMLVPVIGLVQVGVQAHADRYTYLPQIGIYFALVWGVAELSVSWRKRKWILGTAAATVIALLMALSWRQVGYWSSSVHLWRHTLAVTSENDVAERGLGTELLRLGQVDEAIAHDRAALRIRPREANGMTNLANALLRKKEYPEAIELYRAVLSARPNDSEMHRNLGKALYQSGALKESLTQFREALRLRPGDSDAAYSLGNAYLEAGDPKAAIPNFRKAIGADRKNVAAHYNLAIALQRDDQLEEAIAEFRKTLQLEPQKVDAQNNLGIALLKSGKATEAMAEWQEVLRLQPGNAEMHNNLAVALLAQGRLAEAVREWRETLRLQPERVASELSLAWVLATSPETEIRHGNEALQLAQKAFRVAAGNNPMVFRVLAAAYAEIGQYPKAIETATEGAQRAETEGQPALAQLLQADLMLYQQGIPLRDSTHGRGRSQSP
ncbi:MAG: tetratricopeptide repeat protein [Chthoniobacterales bacterium]|nr:tetratricopeptide repeat protein [Chthoniobacterales bacterium]